jgi:hypothetical protein
MTEYIAQAAVIALVAVIGGTFVRQLGVIGLAVALVGFLGYAAWLAFGWGAVVALVISGAAFVAQSHRAEQQPAQKIHTPRTTPQPCKKLGGWIGGPAYQERNNQ